MKIVVVSFLVLPLLCCACVRKSPPEPLVPDVGDGWLSFAIQPPERRGDTTQFHATYNVAGKTARFDFEVIEATPTREADMESILCKGRFLSVPNSDASVLLRNLKNTLEAKTMPSGTVRISELAFACLILGTRQSHALDGGFFTKPPR